VFYTVMDDQTEVEINVFQGENPDARENIQIGEFRVVGLSRVPSGNEIIVDLALDRDGILQVTAKEKKTGLQQRIVIDHALAQLGETGLAEARERVGSLFAPTAGNGAATETATGDGVPFDVAGLLTRAEAKLDDAGEEDRSELIDLIEAIRDARKAGDSTRLAEACEQLNDLIFYLET
jgi:molecular chaperone DnaK